MSQPMTSAPIIKLGGSQLAWDLAAQLLDVTVERGLRRPARAEITLDDPGFEVLTDKAASFAPGTTVSIAFPDAHGSPITLFAGTVTGLRVFCPEDGDHHRALTIVAEDAAHGLGTVSKTISSTNAGLADALRSALTPYLSTVKVTGLPAGSRDAVIVAGSPLEALEQVCERYGLEWWVDRRTRACRWPRRPPRPPRSAWIWGRICGIWTSGPTAPRPARS